MSSVRSMAGDESLEDDTARTYRGYAADPRKQRSWSATNPGNMAIRQELVDRIFELAGPELAGDGKILDAGCGSGWLLEELVRRGVAAERLHGIDLLEQRVAAAAKRVPGARVRRGDCGRLPYRDREFALVLMLTVLSSLPGPAELTAALREARRVLLRGGLLLSYEPRVPTVNRRTRHIRRRDYHTVAWFNAGFFSLTVAPPIARRLGVRARDIYPRLSSAAPLLRTHRLAALRAP